MSNWQQNFVRKMESLKSHWVRCFEAAAEQDFKPVFESYREFAQRQGFVANCPEGHEGSRLFKFALSENAYVILSFRCVGVGRIEFLAEGFAPGWGKLDPLNDQTELASADESWIRRQFERSLDHFVGRFSQAVESCHEESNEPELVEAN